MSPVHEPVIPGEMRQLWGIEGRHVTLRELLCSISDNTSRVINPLLQQKIVHQAIGVVCAGFVLAGVVF